MRPLEKDLLNQLESLRLNSALFVPSLIEFAWSYSLKDEYEKVTQQRLTDKVHNLIREATLSVQLRWAEFIVWFV